MVRMIYLSIGGFAVYGMFALFNYFFLSKMLSYASTLYIIFAVVLLTPLVIIRFNENKRRKELEGNFPIFLQDFVEATRGGMTLPQSFDTIKDNDYGRLGPMVKKMAAQLNWGIPVETVLSKFAKETRSKLISRIISTVMESHRFGGRLTDTFEALSNTAVEVERLRAERRLFLNSQIITGYIIYFVFLVVIIGLQRYLVPSLSTVSTTAALGQVSGVVASKGDLAAEYTEIFRNLILLQGMFAGLTVGKMSEGALVAGLKHSVIMMVVGMTVFIFLG